MGIAQRIRALRGASMPQIQVQNVGKRFGKLTALRNVSFRLDRAQVVGLAGPNGSGKTTLIRIMLGLARASEGMVRINGREPAPWRREGDLQVGYMPQVEAVYPDLTVRANVSFFAKIYQVPRAERDERIGDALRVVHLLDRAGDKVSVLSGGLRRRVGLACALVHRPNLLFLDEPTVGIDPLLRNGMWDTFRELRDAGSVIFISTHYLEEAERCDRVMLLREGSVLAFDTPKNILARTRRKKLEDAFVALMRDGREA